MTPKDFLQVCNVILMPKIGFFQIFPLINFKISTPKTLCKKYHYLHTSSYLRNFSRFAEQKNFKSAEQFQISNFLLSGGRRFHKRCFKCISCSKKLDSNNVRVSGSKLYCKVCLDKIAPPEAPKIYTDTSKLAPSDEKGCPR